MNALTISKAIWYEAEQREILVTHTKIQKLLYIAYGGYYCRYDEQMFDELPVYFPHGPVFSSILTYYQKIDFSKDNPKKVHTENEDVKRLITNVLDIFGVYKAKQLSNWVHRDGTAWAKINKCAYEEWGTVLRLEDIKKEFEPLMVKV